MVLSKVPVVVEKKQRVNPNVYLEAKLINFLNQSVLN
jgi:hypothetical protein